MSKILRFFLLCWCLLFVSELPAQTQSPHEPISIQRESPYEVFQSFMGATQRAEADYELYKQDKSAQKLSALLDDLGRIRTLLDLSQTPPATRTRIADNAIVYLYDILARLPEIPSDTIPGYQIKGDAASLKDLPSRWTIPGTDIQIVRVQEGPYSDEYQFSAATVKNLADYYQSFIDLPLRHPRLYSSLYLERANATGYLMPKDFANVFPDWMQKHYFNTPIWKIVLISLLNIVLIVLAILWIRFGWRFASSRTGVIRQALYILIPLGLLIGLYSSDHFVITQIYPVGSFASGGGLVTSIIYYGLAAWLAWLIVHLVADLLIRSLQFFSKGYDEPLLRLSVKLFAWIAVLLIIFQGADQLGIPAMGLLAGFGVGGIAVALASQSTIENLFGGLSLFADRPFRVGDKIEFNEQAATVLRIGPRSTRLRLVNGALCTVPNSDLAKMHIVNFTQRNACHLDQVISLRSDSSTEDIRRVLIQIRERVLQEPLVEKKSGWPRVQVISARQGRIDIRIRAMVLTGDMSEFLSVQELIMLDVLNYLEEMQLKLIQPYPVAS